MRNNKYLTIKEYAEIRGVSVSAVYKRLSTSLQPYVETIEGKKVLKYQVLFDEGLNDYSTPSNELPQPSSTSFWEEQLREKDKQIERLQEELRRAAASADEKDKYIQEQGRRLAELLEQSNKLQENNQVLIGLANDYKAKLEEGSSSNSNEKKGFFRRLFKDSE